MHVGVGYTLDVMPELIAVHEFVKESWDDYNSPTTSNFVPRMGHCRNSVSSLEDVSSLSASDFPFHFSPPTVKNRNAYSLVQPLKMASCILVLVIRDVKHACCSCEGSDEKWSD